MGSLTTEGSTDSSAEGAAGPVQQTDPWRMEGGGVGYKDLNTLIPLHG